jgi:diguanylate cyclase (GGDEF)-like protein/PAS domain S-box-containing protein
VGLGDHLTRARRRITTSAPVPAWIALLAAGGVAAGTAATAAGGEGHPLPDAHWALVVVSLVVAGSLTVEVRHRGEIESFDMFEVALAPAILLVGGLRAVLLVAVSKAIAQLLLRMPPRKLAFNVAQWTACAGAGALTYAWASARAGSQTALVAAMVVVAVVNLGALLGLFGLLGGRAAARQLLLPADLTWTAGLTVVTTVTGVAAAVGAQEHPQVLLLVIALAAMLHWAGRGYALARADLVTTQNLHAATRVLSAVPDVRATPDAFLAEVVRCCSAGAAELTLRRGDGLVIHRHDAGAEPGCADAGAAAACDGVSRLLVDHDGPLHAVAEEGEVGAALAAAGWRDCLAVPVPSVAGNAGVLAVYDRSGFTEQDRSDETILLGLAREVGAAVQRAELVEEIVAIREDAARIVDTSRDGIAALAEDGCVVTWNHAFATLSGYPSEKVVGSLGLTLLDVRDGDGAPVKLECWAGLGGTALPPDLVVRTVDGQRRWLSCSYASATQDAGSGPLLVVMARDVTDLRLQDRLIAEQSRILELVASDAPLARSLDAVATLVRSLTDAAAAVLVAGERPTGGFRVAVPPGDQDVPSWLHRLPGSLFTIDLEGWRWAEATGEPVVVPDGDVTCWAWPVLDADRSAVRAVIAAWPAPGILPDPNSIRVLTSAGRLAGLALDRDSSHVRLMFQATHDPLTGLPNRRLFLEKCARALDAAAASGRFAVVLFLDLDRFKVINDSLGHDAGDGLLIAVGARLRPVVRVTDTLARFGGDEFTILCGEVPSEREARDLAEQVLALFSAPFAVDGREVFETASVGIALGRAPMRPEDLVQHADAAMYRAKAAGGNRSEFFDAAMRREADERLSDYAALRRAVGGSELEMHYQPTFSLADGSAVGMEALARWRHPTRGLLGPDRFMDLAEETGLIVPLGEQILRTVLRELRESGSPLRVAVNLSARQLTQPNLARTVAEALVAEGLPPDRLALEITESVLLSDSAAMQRVIGQLKRIGVDLSLDDFGTGHSSMDYLKFLPVDELKIEKRFVGGLLTDHRDRAIVTAITQLGHDLGLRVVAEGIETREQSELLRELGCDVGQGYWFGRPAPMRHATAGSLTPEPF